MSDEYMRAARTLDHAWWHIFGNNNTPEDDDALTILEDAADEVERDWLDTMIYIPKE